MAQDTFTEVTTQSWFSRIAGSFAGVLIGILLFLASFAVLWFNEGRSVKTAEALREVQQSLVALPGTEASPQNNGKLIYLTGQAQTDETLVDENFGISSPAVKLARDVEMYQWVESSHSKTREKFGGSKETVTTYTYVTKWYNTPQRTSEFKKPEGHANPEMIYRDAAFVSQNVSLGSFRLTAGLIDKIGALEPLSPDETALQKMPTAIRPRAQLADGYLYLGNQGTPNPTAPRVGDYRIRYRIVPAQINLSIISRQIGSGTGATFEPYRAKNGRMIELLETGTVSADVMVDNAQKSNQLTTWLLRLLGFVLMFIGLALCLKPLSILAAVVPFVGRIVGAGTGLVAFLIALSFSLTTIAVAWIAYRPIFAVALMGGAAIAVYLAGKSRRKVKPV